MEDLPKFKTLDLDRDGGWLTVWFNEPERSNALTMARVADLTMLAEGLAARRDVRGVTLRGRGGVFSAGGDLAAFRKLAEASPDRSELEAANREGAAMFDALLALPQLLVAVVDGPAVAGGVGLAATADVVLATPEAWFSLSEVRIGLVPAQIAPLIVARVGATNARRMMLLGEKLDARSARAIGLVDRVAEADGVDAEIAGLRQQLTKASPGAVRLTKALLSRLPSLDRSGQIAFAAETFAEAVMSADGREGIASFFDKRAPQWNDEPC